MRFMRWTLVLSLVAVLGAACGGGGNGGGEEGGGEGAATDQLVMVDNAFEPSELTVESGVTLTVTNDGAAAHTFTMEEQEIDVTVPPGGESPVDVTLDAGDYPFVCTFHPEMTGTLTVA